MTPACLHSAYTWCEKCNPFHMPHAGHDVGLTPRYTTSCLHEWKDYLGLNERYLYCIKCDLKQETAK